MRLLVTEPAGFSPKAAGILEDAGFSVEFFNGRLEELTGVLGAYDGVVVRMGVQWREPLLDRATQLKFIATLTTGLTHIDLSEAQKRGLQVVSLQGLAGLEQVTSTAEHAFGMLLCLLRGTCRASRSVLEGSWNRDAYIGRELRGKRAGVVGMGRLGKMFGSIAEAFRMDVMYHDPFVEHRRYRRCSSIEELAAEAQIVSLHVKLSPETQGLVGRRYFQACRPGQVLVNTSRGEVVDEDELLKALETGRIAGAALDVLAAEPASGGKIDTPLVEYAREHENVLITPHIGGATKEAMNFTEEILARELVRRYGA